MHILLKNNYHKVIPIYDMVENSKPVIFSVIDGNIDGNIYVDNIDTPRTALVMLFDMLFFSGQENIKFCKEAFELLKHEIFPNMKEDYFDCYCLSDGLKNDVELIFEKMITGRPIRKTWKFNKDMFLRKSNWRARVPDGFRMELMDEAFINKHDCDKGYWDPARKRFGHALVCGAEIASECSACFVGGGQVEISVDTKEQYRNRGFAATTCTAFIEHCISLDLVPNWSCWDFRAASISLAKKLGFEENTNDVVFGLTKEYV